MHSILSTLIAHVNFRLRVLFKIRNKSYNIAYNGKFKKCFWDTFMEAQKII